MSKSHSSSSKTVSRRLFLRGTAGATLALPLLESAATTRVYAAENPKQAYAAFLVGMNGVQQSGFGTEPERFWPSKLGALTKASMQAEPDRATSELADHAERLLMVRGIKFAFPGNGCGHTGGGNQVLTAAKVSADPAKNLSLAMGESADNYIARQFGGEPLTLYAGPKDGYINDHVSFRGAKDVRVGENNPYVAYTRMTGLQGAGADLLKRIATRRTSVNDLVRTEMQQLLNRKDLSTDDRARLDMHFSTLRDMEMTMSNVLPDDTVTALKGVDGKHRQNATRLQVERLQMDLIAFAFSGGIAKVAFMQVGDGTDSMTFEVNGKVLPRFHLVSHRASDDGAVSDGTMPDAVNQHHDIDKIVMRQFKYLLDKLEATKTPTGSLLDLGFATWCNQIGTGNHTYHNIPYLIAGKANGFLRTGQYFSATGNINAADVGNQTNNKILNVLINAAGVRKAGGALVDDFGDPSLEKGTISGLIA